MNQAATLGIAGVKWRFYDAGEMAWQVPTYLQIGFNNPGSHSDERGLTEHGTSFLLPAEVMKDFGAFSLNADLGFVRQPDANEWVGGVVIGHELSHGVELAAELRWEARAYFHDTESIVNVGVCFAVSEKCTLLASVGRDLHNRCESQASLIAYFGLQTRL